MKASDLMKILNADPDYQEIQRQREEAFSDKAALFAKDERNLVRELNEEGFDIKSVWDFVNSDNAHGFLRPFSGPYKGAYLILVKHLKIKHLRKIREGIIRALTVKDANEAASEALISAFNHEQDPHLKWVLANALRTVLRRSQKRKFPEYKEVYRGTKRS